MSDCSSIAKSSRSITRNTPDSPSTMSPQIEYTERYIGTQSGMLRIEHPPRRWSESMPQSVNLLDMIWPETGLQVSTSVSDRERDKLTDSVQIELTIDFVTLTLSPTEFIQLAASLRLSVDGILEHHPGMQKAVVAAFDIKS